MAETKHSSAAPKRDEKEPFYLFDNEQSARIETIQLAMRGISELISDDITDHATELQITRVNVAAIFDMIAQSLDDAIGVKARRHVFINPADIKGSVQ